MLLLLALKWSVCFYLGLDRERRSFWHPFSPPAWRAGAADRQQRRSSPCSSKCPEDQRVDHSSQVKSGRKRTDGVACPFAGSWFGCSYSADIQHCWNLHQGSILQAPRALIKLTLISGGRVIQGDLKWEKFKGHQDRERSQDHGPSFPFVQWSFKIQFKYQNIT